MVEWKSIDVREFPLYRGLLSVLNLGIAMELASSIGVYGRMEKSVRH